MLSHWLCFKMADKIIMWKLRCGDMWRDEFFPCCWRWYERLKNNCEGGKLIANKFQKSDSLLSSKSHVVYEIRYNVSRCSEKFKCNFSSLKFRYRVSITYKEMDVRMWSMWHQSIRKLEDNLKIEFIFDAFLSSNSTSFLRFVLVAFTQEWYLFICKDSSCSLFIFICRSIFSRSHSYTKYVRSPTLVHTLISPYLGNIYHIWTASKKYISFFGTRSEV